MLIRYAKMIIMTTEERNKLDQLCANYAQVKNGIPKITFTQLYSIAEQLATNEELQNAINLEKKQRCLNLAWLAKPILERLQKAFADIDEYSIIK
jgi:hypothetical protein